MLSRLFRQLISPEVHPDGSVTFRFRAPNAQQVSLEREGATAVPMQKDEQGVWSVTTDPLEPDLYGYSFVADGVTLIDPSNPLMKPNLLHPQSVVHVPGPPSTVWEIGDVPHGTIHHHFYRSGTVGDDRDFYVYTPPGYDPKAKRRYPTLYLLHGFSDDASGWTAVGRAHVILDNLIAQGKAKPMIVVMPLGYGAPEIVSPTSRAFRDASLVERNMDRFRQALSDGGHSASGKDLPGFAGPPLPSHRRAFHGRRGVSLYGTERPRPFRLDRRFQLRRAGRGL